MKIDPKSIFSGGHFFDDFLEGQYEGANGPEDDRVSGRPAQA